MPHFEIIIYCHFLIHCITMCHIDTIMIGASLHNYTAQYTETISNSPSYAYVGIMEHCP